MLGWNVNARQAFRLAHGMSQQNVADQWNTLYPAEAGRRPLTSKQVSYWETWPVSGREPSITALARLARIYGCDTRDLLDPADPADSGGREPPLPPSAATTAGTGHNDHRQTSLSVTDLAAGVDGGAAEGGAAGSGAVGLARDPEPFGRRDGVVDRRELLSVVAGVAVSEQLAHLVAAEPHEMGRVLDSRSGAGQPGYHEMMADRMMVHFEATGPTAVLAPALEHFRAVRGLAEQHQSTDAHRRLTRAAAKIGTLLGFVTWEDEWRARAWFGIAQRAAAESGDGVLAGWAVAGESLLDYYAGRQRACLRSLQAAQGLVRGGVVAAVVAARTARAHAAAGEQRQALQALEAAARYLQGSPGQQQELFSFTGAQLAFYAAKCHAHLGRQADTEEEAARALRLYETSPHYMDPALVRLDLAAARLHRQRPDVEGAIAAATDSLELLPPEHRTGPVRQRTSELVLQMRRYSAEPAVQDFVGYVAEL